LRLLCETDETGPPSRTVFDSQLGALTNAANPKTQHRAAEDFQWRCEIMARRDKAAAQARNRSVAVHGNARGSRSPAAN
jgi:hypothetical protein